MRCDRIWRNARLLTMGADRCDAQDLGAIDHGLIAARGDRILFAGDARQAPALDAADIIDCDGRWITPGLIDPHTHLVYGGDRAAEFERRLAGETYAQIAATGGGIRATMAATRAADEAALVATALPRLDALLAEGVTTVEIKSGYGLTLADEIKQLRAARALAGLRRVTLRTSLLAAHAVPPEFEADPDGYVALVTHRIIPEAARLGLADAVDAFCDAVGFSPQQIARVFDAARAHGLPVKLHAEQLGNQHGAALAARFGALSADHLEYLDQAGIAAMAASGTVATLLPGAFYCLRETQLPPVAALRQAGVPIALGTDCNPGTAPLTSILLAMNMAATLFRLTVAECLAGVTREAARALGMSEIAGTLAVGRRCDLAIWSIARPASLVYQIGLNPLHARVWGGQDG